MKFRIALLLLLIPVFGNAAPATRPTAAAAGAEVDAQLASAREQLATQGTNLRAALARIAALEARPVPRPSPDIDPRDFGAKGDSVHDDGPSIQAAIDSLVAMNGKGVPNSGKVTHQVYPNGGTVRLAPGAYRITRPIKLWGMVTLAGHGRDTVINADGDAIDLAGVELGGPGSGYSHVWSTTRDLAINSGGNAFSSSTGGLFATRIDRVQICSAGWGVYLPDGKGGGCYCQDTYIADVHQFNPGSGGVLLRGNQNVLARYYVSNGTGGPKGTGFKSPWENGQLAMIDVGGTNNRVEWCHVEFNVGQDKTGKPGAVVLTYAYRGNGAAAGTCSVDGNWHEMWPWRAFGDLNVSTVIDNCVVRGDLLEDLGGKVMPINGGSHKN